MFPVTDINASLDIEDLTTLFILAQLPSKCWKKDPRSVFFVYDF